MLALFLPRALAVVVFGAITTAACDPNPTFDAQAHKFLETGGPQVACCRPPAIVGQANDVCAAEAETKCAFVRNATFVTKNIAEAGNAARNITIEVQGPSGKASCVVHVADHGKRNGGIYAESAHCNRIP